jgi:Methyltransferase domain
MGWFSSRASGSRKDQGSVQTEIAPQVHRSLALAALFEEIRKGRKAQVLDLGSAVGSNVEYLSQFGCKLFIEDLYAALSSRVTSEEGDLARPEFFAEFLALPDDTRFDVVLAWDRFNYLQRKELAAFGEQLRRYTRPGSPTASRSRMKSIWSTNGPRPPSALHPASRRPRSPAS